jgi:flagellar biogenesis protein FliO
MMDTMIWAMMKMILALGIVCTLLFFLVRLLKRSGVAKRNFPFDSGIKVLTTQLIAPQKYISLVEIGGEVLALGISEAQITFLAKIENKELLEKIMDHRSERVEPFSLSRYFLSSPLKVKGPKIGLLRRSHGK